MALTNRPEFQAIILAGGEGLRLSPLSDQENSPKCLLPIANRPMLYYQLNLLESSGFKEAIVLTVKSASNKISQYVREIYRNQGGALEAVIEVVEEGSDTAEAIRSIADRIKTDFIVISSDFVSNVALYPLVDLHRTYESSLTMLLKENSISQEDTTVNKNIQTPSLSSQKSNSNTNPFAEDPNESLEYIGLDEKKQRVLYFSSAADMENNEMHLSKTLLKRCPNISITSRLFDTHLYIFAKWVVDLLIQKPKILSLKYDLVPYLVRKQFRNASDLKSSGIPQSALESNQKLAYQKTSSPYNSEDYVKCYASIIKSDSGCWRANTFTSYSEVNREISRGAIEKYKPVRFENDDTKVQNAIGKECAVGSSLQFGEKSSVKKSVIGNHCKIGSNVKITNSVILDHVIIGDKSIIHNSIIGSNAHIRDEVNLKDVVVAFNKVVLAGEYKSIRISDDRQ